MVNKGGIFKKESQEEVVPLPRRILVLFQERDGYEAAGSDFPCGELSRAEKGQR